MPFINNAESGAGFVNIESGAGFVNIESGRQNYLNVGNASAIAPRGGMGYESGISASACTDVLAMDNPEDLEGDDWDLYAMCLDQWTDAEGKPTDDFYAASDTGATGLEISGETRSWFSTLGDVSANLLKALGVKANGEEEPPPATGDAATTILPGSGGSQTNWLLIGGIGAVVLLGVAVAMRKD
jgi:hypothetical protein